MKDKIIDKKAIKENRKQMQFYLEQLQESGTELLVDGEIVFPKEAAKRAVREDCAYMADYVLGENGKIEQVRFDRVRLW